MSSPLMPPPTAFAAIALAAVSWDGVLSMAGSRALRHALDYREPYRHRGDEAMVALMNELLAALRRNGLELAEPMPLLPPFSGPGTSASSPR